MIKQKNITLVIPSYNNLEHLKNVYTSILKHAPQVEVVLLDDGSIDGTWKWIQKQNVIKFRSELRVGHTILYDKGIELASNEIVGILHADMIIGPNYIENIVKHLHPGKVVCGTRIEPPLHPEGKEKIIKDFGQDFDTLNIEAFESFCIEAQKKEQNIITKGMFAPWILYKKDFQSIGGHDNLFAPFPYEDSDIFQRWVLAGYELIQSRDAFVYHLTCRGHRWTNEIGKDDDYFKNVSSKAARNYIRKWGSWIKNDEYHYPIISKRYQKAFLVKNCNYNLIPLLEPWCDILYTHDELGINLASYYQVEQKNTIFNLKNKFKVISRDLPIEDIIVEFDGNELNNNNFQILQNLQAIISESNELGIFELDIFKITINNLNTYQDKLINLNDKYYKNQLLN